MQNSPLRNGRFEFTQKLFDPDDVHPYDQSPCFKAYSRPRFNKPRSSYKQMTAEEHERLKQLHSLVNGTVTLLVEKMISLEQRIEEMRQALE